MQDFMQEVNNHADIHFSIFYLDPGKCSQDRKRTLEQCISTLNVISSQTSRIIAKQRNQLSKSPPNLVLFKTIIIISPGLPGLRIWEWSIWEALALMKFAISFVHVHSLSGWLLHSDDYFVPAISWWASILLHSMVTTHVVS